MRYLKSYVNYNLREEKTMKPLKVKMSRKEFEKRMKDIEKEDRERLEREMIENDKFLESIRNKSVKEEKIV